MKRLWRAAAFAGTLSFVGVSAGDEKLVPVPETQPAAGQPVSAQPAAGCPACAAQAAAGSMGAAGITGYGTPAVVGDYRVGHIHEGGLPHIFHYSTYNPYLDNLTQPIRQDVYGGSHARYYAGYRNVYAPNWHEFYVPRYYAPAAYGYDPYGPSYYGYGQTRSTFYAPNYYAPPAAAATPPAPPASYRPSGFRYTGDPGIYSPFGVGSSSYFGVYGSAGY